MLVAGLDAQLLFIGRLGPLELGIILLIVLLLFGTSRLPGVGSALGKGIRSFKTSVTGEDEESQSATPTTSEERGSNDPRS